MDRQAVKRQEGDKPATKQELNELSLPLPPVEDAQLKKSDKDNDQKLSLDELRQMPPTLIAAAVMAMFGDLDNTSATVDKIFEVFEKLSAERVGRTLSIVKQKLDFVEQLERMDPELLKSIDAKLAQETDSKKKQNSRLKGLVSALVSRFIQSNSNLAADIVTAAETPGSYSTRESFFTTNIITELAPGDVIALFTALNKNDEYREFARYCINSNRTEALTEFSAKLRIRHKKDDETVADDLRNLTQNPFDLISSSAAEVFGSVADSFDDPSDAEKEARKKQREKEQARLTAEYEAESDKGFGHSLFGEITFAEESNIDRYNKPLFRFIIGSQAARNIRIELELEIQAIVDSLPKYYSLTYDKDFEIHEIRDTRDNSILLHFEKGDEKITSIGSLTQAEQLSFILKKHLPNDIYQQLQTALKNSDMELPQLTEQQEEYFKSLEDAPTQQEVDVFYKELKARVTKALESAQKADKPLLIATGTSYFNARSRMCKYALIHIAKDLGIDEIVLDADSIFLDEARSLITFKDKPEIFELNHIITMLKGMDLDINPGVPVRIPDTGEQIGDLFETLSGSRPALFLANIGKLRSLATNTRLEDKYTILAIDAAELRPVEAQVLNQIEQYQALSIAYQVNNDKVQQISAPGNPYLLSEGQLRQMIKTASENSKN